MIRRLRPLAEAAVIALAAVAVGLALSGYAKASAPPAEGLARSLPCAPCRKPGPWPPSALAGYAHADVQADTQPVAPDFGALPPRGCR